MISQRGWTSRSTSELVKTLEKSDAQVLCVWENNDVVFVHTCNPITWKAGESQI
jgi:hypothetical protein